MGHSYLKSQEKGPRVHLVSSCIQIRHLKLFVGDSECQIKARDEFYFWSRFPPALKILPEVIVLINFMVPKHYFAYSQDPSGHWKSGGHLKMRFPKAGNALKVLIAK